MRGASLEMAKRARKRTLRFGLGAAVFAAAVAGCHRQPGTSRARADLSAMLGPVARILSFRVQHATRRTDPNAGRPCIEVRFAAQARLLMAGGAAREAMERTFPLDKRIIVERGDVPVSRSLLRELGLYPAERPVGSVVEFEGALAYDYDPEKGWKSWGVEVDSISAEP